MEIVAYFLYLATLRFIQVYKWIELQILKLIKPFIRGMVVNHLAKMGVILHTEDKNSNLTLKNEKEVLAKSKYSPLIHINIKDFDQVLLRGMNKGSLGFGEAYMDGLWDMRGDISDLSEFMRRVMELNLMDLYLNRWNRFLEWLQFSAFNLQTKQRAYEVGVAHYDLGNDLFEVMLDSGDKKLMQYSCAYWAKTDNLTQAQEHKLELIAKKLDLKPGMRVLDLGCGWGTLCKYLAEKHDVSCVGVTISKEGVAYGKKINQGLPVDIRLQDYRELDEKFDRIVSIEMFEHVGYKNHKEFMQVVRRCLVDDGIFLLHIYGRNHVNIPRSTPFLHKYILPNGGFPNPLEITKSTEGLFVIEDWHNFGQDFARTFRAWRENFVNAWPKLEGKHGSQLDGKFYRMWTFYLCSAEGLFWSRKLQLWQIILSPDGVKQDFRAPR